MGRVLPLLLLLAGCATEVVFDPEGLLCDAGAVCPDGYACIEGVCRVPCTGAGCPGVTVNRCANVTCDAPPTAFCVDGTLLRAFLAQGACETSTGECTYPAVETTCQAGCVDGRCVGEGGCAGVTCTTPPSPQCEGSNLRSWLSPGTCSSSGQCNYVSSVQSCPNGCAAGACSALQLAFSETAPAVPSVLNAVDSAPGSSGNHVLVAGPGGYVGRWNGAAWAKLNSGTQAELRAVSLYGSGSSVGGAVVGDNGTVLLYDGSSLTKATVPGLTAALRSVHAASAQQVLVGGGAQAAVRSGSAWSLMSVSGGSLDAVSDVLLQGSRGYAAGVATRGSSTGPAVVSWNSLSSGGSVNLDSSPGVGFRALSPDFDTANSQYLFVSQETFVRRFNTQTGEVELSEVFSVPEGDEVVALTPAASASGTSAAWALSAPSVGDQPGALFRVQRTGTSAPVVSRVAPVYGNAALSRNDASGVVLVDSLVASANVSRHDASSATYLHFGEDWVGGDQGGSGRVLVTDLGDVAWQDGGAWRLSRMEDWFEANATAGSGPLVVVGKAGGILRWTAQDGYTPLDSGSTRQLNGVCRVSDGLWYAVGDVGTALMLSGPGFHALQSFQQPVVGSTQNLRAVACVASGPSYAVGNGGAVLRLVGSQWQAVSPSPQTSVNLTSVLVSGGTVWVGGDGYVGRFDGTSWTQLPALTGLSGMVRNADGDIFARAGSKVYRFNGGSWTQVLAASKPLRGGFAAGRNVTFVGDDGVVVDGR
jgi:hypothetical protein